MNLSPFVFVFLWVLAMAVLVGWSWWRKWHRELAAARHTYHAAAADVEAATVFYGSMQLDPALERHHVSGQNWRERTMTELAPEALDPGPGEPLPPLVAPGPVQPPIREDAQGWAGGQCAQNSRQAAGAMTGGPGLGPASLAIGFLPAPTRLADTGDITEAHENHPHPDEDWLDTQLADLFAWVRTQLEAAA